MVDQLPLAVRIAMLEGVRAERIIAGGYADGRGGVCPMLAAHRHGGRWSFPDFARTWDEFAEAPIEGLRDADPAHVAALVEVLTASIEDDLRVDAAIPDAVDLRPRRAVEHRHPAGLEGRPYPSPRVAGRPRTRVPDAEDANRPLTPTT